MATSGTPAQPDKEKPWMLPETTNSIANGSPSVNGRPTPPRPRARAPETDPLKRYRRHAERWGTEQVFEAAMNDPDFAAHPRELVERLAELARCLANIDPKWRSPLNDPAEDKRRRDRDQKPHNVLHLVPYLVNVQGHGVETVAALLGISERSLRGRLRAAQRTEYGGDDQYPSPAEIGTQTPRKHWAPDPTFAGSSPNGEVAPALNGQLALDEVPA
jgi:hypothetical protein